MIGSQEPQEKSASPFISGVVLAAGQSQRMGTTKQLLPLAERPLLRHVIDNALASRLSEVIVVLGHDADELQQKLMSIRSAKLRLVVNSEYTEGLSSSLRAGLAHADPRAIAAAIVLGDQPELPSELIDRVLAAFCETDAAVLQPMFDSSADASVPGHPVVLARRIWPEVIQLKGDRGARALLDEHPTWLRTLRIPQRPPADVDTRADYQELLQRHAETISNNP